MKITFLGHAGFLLEGTNGRIVIDPFITELPTPSLPLAELNPELILITHGHGDHMGDAAELARLSKATVVGNVEIANYYKPLGVNSHGMNIGGTWDFGWVKVKMTSALHSSSIGAHPAQYLGNPGGFLIFMDQLTIYHAGDTGLFGDMALIGRNHPINVALLPIGDNFTMGPADALAAVQMLQPKQVIPMHYNTWEIIQQDPQQFKVKVEAQTSSEVIVLQPGDQWATSQKSETC